MRSSYASLALCAACCRVDTDSSRCSISPMRSSRTVLSRARSDHRCSKVMFTSPICCSTCRERLLYFRPVELYLLALLIMADKCFLHTSELVLKSLLLLLEECYHFLAHLVCPLAGVLVDPVNMLLHLLQRLLHGSLRYKEPVQEIAVQLLQIMLLLFPLLAQFIGASLDIPDLGSQRFVLLLLKVQRLLPLGAVRGELVLPFLALLPEVHCELFEARACLMKDFLYCLHQFHQLPVVLLNLRLLPRNAEEVEPVNVVGNGGGRIYNGSDARDVAGSHQARALVDPDGLLSHWKAPACNPAASHRLTRSGDTGGISEGHPVIMFVGQLLDEVDRSCCI